MMGFSEKSGQIGKECERIRMLQGDEREEALDRLVESYAPRC